MTSGSLEFPMGAVIAQCITIPITDDTIVEAHETFTVILTVNTNTAGVRVGNAETTVTILNDNDDSEYKI